MNPRPADEAAPVPPGTVRPTLAGAASDALHPTPGPETQVTPAGPKLPRGPSPAPATTPEERYRIVRHVASGGMGDVYEAHDTVLNRRVALKKMAAGVLASPADVERFHREARAAAQLDHPHVVPVYDVGVHDGRPFYTMPLVDGRSLAAQIAAGGPLAPADAVRMLLPVVEAVEHAQRGNLIHRDLKPENVLVDGHGRPRVTDFGLARHLLDPGGLTGPAQMLGTPRYMAPEQIRDAAGPVGPATDVYGLGGVLVFLLTGRPPFAAGSLPELLLKVLEDPPQLPGASRPGVPPALDDVCRRCLQKNPADRFPSAAALRDALAAWLAGAESAAGSGPAAEAPARPGRRPRGVLIAAGVGLLLAVVAAVAFRPKPSDEPAGAGGAGIPTPGAQPATRNPDLATNTPKPNDASRDGGPKVDDVKAVEPKGTGPVPVGADPEVFTLDGHEGRVWVAFAPDSKSLLSWSDDSTLRRWDLTTGQPAKPLIRERTSVMGLRVSAARQAVAAALSDGRATVWTLPDWEDSRVYTDPAHPVTAVAFSPDGTKLAVGTGGGRLAVFDWRAKKEIAACVGHTDRVIQECLFFSADGARLTSGSRDHSIRVWDAATGRPVHAVRGRDALWAVVPTPDPARVVAVQVAVTGSGGPMTVHALDLATGAVVKELGEHWVKDVAVSPGGRSVWAVGADDLTVWDLTTFKAVGDDAGVRGGPLAFLPGGHALLGGVHGRDTTLDVFRVKGFGLERTRTIPAHRTAVTSLAVSPDGRRAATGDERGAITVWDVPALVRPR